MGIEANAELQAIARRLKDENDALRGLLIRLGYGGLIQNALQELHPEGMHPHPYDQPPQMYMGDNMPQHSLPPHAQGVPTSEHMQPPQQQQPPMMSHPQQRQSVSNVPASAPATQTQFTNIQQPSGVRPNELASSGMPAFAPQSDALAVRWTDEGNSTAPEPWMRNDQQNVPSIKRQRSATTGPSAGQAGSDDNSLLSINLPSRDGKGQNGSNSDQQQPGLTPGTWNSLMGMINNVAAGRSDGQSSMQQTPARQQQPQSAGGGSAFLKNLTPAHRVHQNDALLNPNPLGFALQFSDEPAPDQSWWDRNGGGTFGHDAFLDEKANAVAQAQMQASQHNGSQSPFDISAFLTTGTTPTPGGVNFSAMPAGFTPALAAEVDPMSEAGARLKQGGKEIAKSSPSLPTASAKTTLSPAEHIQTFLRLLERRAIRAGEQRHDRRRQSNAQGQGQNATPWLDTGSDASSEDDNTSQGSRSSRDRSMITPNSAYSRLAQHPIFLRTDARELEDMINSIDASKIATVSAQGSGSGAPLEVDAAAIDRLMQGLDRKLSRGGSTYRPVDATSLPIKAEGM